MSDVVAHTGRIRANVRSVVAQHLSSQEAVTHGDKDENPPNPDSDCFRLADVELSDDGSQPAAHTRTHMHTRNDGIWRGAHTHPGNSPAAGLSSLSNDTASMMPSFSWSALLAQQLSMWNRQRTIVHTVSGHMVNSSKKLNLKQCI